MQYGSLFSLPRRAAPAKPLPNSTPFTAGMANSACASRFSSPPNIGAPTPGGQARHGTLHHAADGVPRRCRRRDLRAHGRACRGIQHRKAAARPLRRKGIERAVRDAPDLRDMGENLHALRRQQLQGTGRPATHRGAVSRPEKCPPPEAACAP